MEGYNKEIFEKMNEQVKKASDNAKLAMKKIDNVTNFFKPVELTKKEFYGMEFSISLNENGSITLSPMTRNDVASNSLFEKIKKI